MTNNDKRWTSFKARPPPSLTLSLSSLYRDLVNLHGRKPLKLTAVSSLINSTFKVWIFITCRTTRVTFSKSFRIKRGYVECCPINEFPMTIGIDPENQNVIRFLYIRTQNKFVQNDEFSHRNCFFAMLTYIKSVKEYKI